MAPDGLQLPADLDWFGEGPRLDALAGVRAAGATGHRHWTYARAWLRNAISEAESG